MDIIKEQRTEELKIGSIIEYKEYLTDELKYDLICTDDTTGEYCVLDLKEGKVKSSRVRNIECITESYVEIKNIFNKNDIKLIIKENR